MGLNCGKKNGFTLLEVVASLAVLSIVLVSVYKMHGQTILMGNSAKFYAEASILADRVLSNFDSTPLKKRFPKEDAGVFEEPFDNYQWRITVRRPEGELLDEIVRDMVKIDIAVERTEDEQTFHLTAYRFLRP